MLSRNCGSSHSSWRGSGEESQGKEGGVDNVRRWKTRRMLSGNDIKYTEHNAVKHSSNLCKSTDAPVPLAQSGWAEHGQIWRTKRKQTDKNNSYLCKERQHRKKKNVDFVSSSSRLAATKQTYTSLRGDHVPRVLLDDRDSIIVFVFDWRKGSFPFITTLLDLHPSPFLSLHSCTSLDLRPSLLPLLSIPTQRLDQPKGHVSRPS